MICEEQAKLAANAAVRKKMLALAGEWHEMAERVQQIGKSSKQA